MAKRVTFGAVLLIGMLLAACTAGIPSSARAISTSAPSGSAASRTTPTPAAEATTTAAPGSAQTDANAQPAVPTAPNRCPPIVANPVGCPAPLPPQPIGPQGGHARILPCGQLIDSAPLLRGSLAICGAAFRPGESITVTVTGRLGTTSWQTMAGAGGTFRTALPGAACQLLPAYLSARGNRGSVSNTLPLTMIACRRIPG